MLYEINDKTIKQLTKIYERLEFELMCSTEAYYQNWRDNNEYEESFESKEKFKRDQKALKLLGKVLKNPIKHEKKINYILYLIDEKEKLRKKRQSLYTIQYEIEKSLIKLEHTINNCNEKIRLNNNRVENRNFFQKLFYNIKEESNILNQTLNSEIRQAKENINLKKIDKNKIDKDLDEISLEIDKISY